MMWNDPVWLCWQVEHQKIGDPDAYSIWLMKKMGIVIRVNVLPMMKALSKAMISANEATKRFQRFQEVFKSVGTFESYS